MKGDAAVLLDGVIAQYETIEWKAEALQTAIAVVGEPGQTFASAARWSLRTVIHVPGHARHRWTWLCTLPICLPKRSTNTNSRAVDDAAR